MGTDSTARRPRSVRLADSEVELFRLWAEEAGLTGQRAGVSNVMRDLAVEAVQVLLKREDVDFEPVEVDDPVFRASDYREMIRSSYNKPTLMDPPAWLKEARGELARVGGNLNQMQRAINQGKIYHTPELLEMLKDVREWQYNLVEALGGWRKVHEILDSQRGI